MTFEALQRSRIENSLATHTQALASKKRLGRVQDEYKAHRTTLLTARSEYQRLNASAEKKLEEEKEKEKKRKAYGAQKEAKIRLREEAEAAERQAEEERLRAEAGAYSLVPLYMRDAHARMEERREEEEAEVVRKRREEERLAEERAAAAEQARKKAQREQEAEERAQLRSQAAKTSWAPAPKASAWQRPSAQTSWAPAPKASAWGRPSAQTSSAPAPRAQSPAPAPSPVSATGPPKIGVAPGGWRQRMAEKEKQGVPGTPTSATSSPVMANSPLPEVKKDTDWFETVPAKGVWPNRLRGKV